ncbi:MAG TPA: GNAT family N-acetyltransferase [Clostridia bacterium]|nr:GNAT family N-acetyltransferase [Clostridia bacterium]
MMVLKTGQLTKHIGERTEQDQYVMRLLAIDELKAAVALQKYVYEQLPNKQVLYMDSYEEMLEDMKNGAKLIGVYNKAGELIAYRHIGFPGKSPKNLGNDINMPMEEQAKVAHLETTVVHPDYRGNSLQSLTLQQAIPMVKKLGYGHLLCTVSPQNFYSLYNIIKNGLRVKALKKKYGTDKDGKDGIWRFILHRNLETIYAGKASHLLRIPLGDLEKQKKLINDGFVGLWLSKESKLLNYVRFEEALA